MKCSSKRQLRKYVSLFLVICICIPTLFGCQSFQYDMGDPLHIRSTVNLPIVRPAGLSKKNVVIPYDAYVFDDASYEYESGLLINETKNNVVCAVNPHKKIYPASMTKILTAILVMEAVESGQITLNDTVVVKKKIEFNEENVLVLGLEVGDYITVDALLHGLLISSFNDCAVVLARYVAGSTGKFAEMMNAKARELGATNSHFVNPHGLHDKNHYTTPYDLYLIFKEFLTKDTLIRIDAEDKYVLTYENEDGKEEQELTPTNGFLSSSFEMPAGYHITGWKTGTTDKAGSCIILEFIKDDTNDSYICMVSNAKDHEALYTNVEDMLKEIY